MEKINAEELAQTLQLSDEDLGSVNGGIRDWRCFGQCILDNHGEDIPQLDPLVRAIKGGNWFNVSKLATERPADIVWLTTECMDACTRKN